MGLGIVGLAVGGKGSDGKGKPESEPAGGWLALWFCGGRFLEQRVRRYHAESYWLILDCTVFDQVFCALGQGFWSEVGCNSKDRCLS